MAEYCARVIAKAPFFKDGFSFQTGGGGAALAVNRMLRPYLEEKNITNLAAMFCDQFLMLKDGKIFAFGSAKEVITEENIREVYGVNTEIMPIDGCRHMVLKRTV